MSIADRRATLAFFALALVVLAAGYGLRDPWPADEPRFVLVARHMLESGDFLFSRVGQTLYPDKPPVYFWLLAAAQQLVGSWRWSFLLPSLLSGLGTLALVWDLGRRVWTPRAGLWAATAVLVSLQFVYQAKRAQIDPTLVLLTTLSLYGLLRHLLLGPQWRWYLAGCFAAGLGVITKGVGFLPLLALVPAALMARAGWQGLVPAGGGQGWRWAGGALAFLAAIGLWLVPLLVLTLGGSDPQRGQFLHEILFKQTAQRYANAWHHHEPWWYFGQVVAFYWLPFSLALPWLVPRWRRAWRERDARVWLPLAWSAMVLVFFSLSAGKRDMYLLPALPALALAAAPYLDEIAGRRGFRWAVLAFTGLLGGALAAAGALALFGDPSFEARLVAERGVGGEARWLWWMLLGVGGSSLLALLAWRLRGALHACAWLLLALWCGYGFVVHPLLDDENSARAVMQRARALVGPEATIGLVDWKEQNLLQAVGPVAEFGYRESPRQQLEDGLAWAHDGGGEWLLVRRSEALACLGFSEREGVLRVGTANRRQWWLFRAAQAGACEGLPRSSGDAGDEQE